MSIGTAFRATLLIENCKISNMQLRMSAFILMQSQFTMKNVTLDSITKELTSVARVLRIEAQSTVTVIDSTFTNINFSIIGVTDSTLQLYSTLMRNITAPRNIIECYTSTGIIFNNFTMVDSQSTQRPSMIDFRG